MHHHLRQSRSTKNFFLIRDTADMPELMVSSDMAIFAGGTTAWELAFMGVPTLVIILAENQRAVAEGLDERGAVINLGWHHNLSPVRIAKTLENLLLNAAIRGKMAEIRFFEYTDDGLPRFPVFYGVRLDK